MKSYGLPRKDPLKALMLERQKAYRKTDRDMAEIIGVSRNTWSAMINHRHTDEWELGQLIAVCIRLNITRAEFTDSLTYVRRI